jgi:hypothetical protein
MINVQFTLLGAVRRRMVREKPRRCGATRNANTHVILRPGYGRHGHCSGEADMSAAACGCCRYEHEKHGDAEYEYDGQRGVACSVDSQC